MNPGYGRDLDLNLLRVFVVVADTGSVTAAASQLYLTQPAISAALRRLTTAIGAPLFGRQGRGIALTSRGERLLAELRPHLMALVDATLAPAQWNPMTSDRTLRIGLSDASEQWLLPPLLRVLNREAPKLRIIVIPIQFRTVGEALAMRRVDLAVTVVEDLHPAVKRRELFRGGFVCLFDPRHTDIKRSLSEKKYFEHQHVIVSYNGDLRGVVEDYFQKTRNIRCSVSGFASLGAIVEGSALLATIPELIARSILRTHPKLRTVPVPFDVPGTPVELLWPAATDDDAAASFMRAKVIAVAEKL